MKTTTLTPEKNYQTSIVVNNNASEVFEKISQVQEWWATNFEGSASKQGDVFTVHFGDTYVTFEITEAIPGKKVVWYVTDCYLPWLKDKKEWNGTEAVFEISETGNGTRVDMTHVGLTPEVECYAGCEKGWNHHIQDSLVALLTEGKGMPQNG